MNENTMRSIEHGLAWCGPVFIVTFIYDFGYLGIIIHPQKYDGNVISRAR